MAALSDKEIEVLNYIARNSSSSQRELAKVTGISLGLINVILKRFIKTGYVRATHLNKKKLEYLLTPQGFIATGRRLYNYATTTIRNYNRIHANLVILVTDLHRGGYDYFSIHGEGELRELLESIFRTAVNGEAPRLGTEHSESPRAIVLNISPDNLQTGFNGNVVNVLDKIGLRQ